MMQPSCGLVRLGRGAWPARWQQEVRHGCPDARDFEPAPRGRPFFWYGSRQKVLWPEIGFRIIPRR